MYLGYQNSKIKYYIPAPIDEPTVEQWVETQDEYVMDGDEYVLNDAEYQEKQKQKEKERVNNLTMTALDFIGVLQCFGLSLQQINDYLESHLELKMQLTYCQNVYCGVVKKLCPLTVAGIEITVQMIEIAFKNKHGEN